MVTQDLDYGKEYFCHYCGGLGYTLVTLYPSLKPFVEAIIETLLELYGHSNELKVLDIGCARGYLVKMLRDYGIESFGVDISQYAILVAPSDIKPYLYVCDVAREKLPFSDEFFDLCVSIATFEHIDPKSLRSHTLREVRRVLKPSGVLVINVPNPLILSEREREEHVFVVGKDTWINFIEASGFRYDPRLTRLFERVRRRENKSMLRYHVNLLRLIYKRSSRYIKTLPDSIHTMIAYMVLLRRTLLPNDFSIVFIKL